MKFRKKKIKHPMAIQETLPGMWKMLRRFWPEISKHRWLVNGSLLAVLAELVLRSLEPWPVKFVFDRVLAIKHATRWSGVPGMTGLQGMDPITLLTVAGLALVTGVGDRNIPLSPDSLILPDPVRLGMGVADRVGVQDDDEVDLRRLAGRLGAGLEQRGRVRGAERRAGARSVGEGLGHGE